MDLIRWEKYPEENDKDEDYKQGVVPLDCLEELPFIVVGERFSGKPEEEQYSEKKNGTGFYMTGMRKYCPQGHNAGKT
jgi:hypothetical protein